MLRHFEDEMRTTPKIHALIAITYVRTELQLMFAWCMTGSTREEYDSEERKRSKEEKVLLMKSVRDIMTQEGAAVACTKRGDALCFVRFMLEQISVPALNTCAKMLREDNDRAKTLLLQALSNIHQSKPMRVNMKEPVELEPMKKVDKIRRFSNKELRLTKESSVRMATDVLQVTETESASQYCRRRRWNNDREPEIKMQKGEG